MIPHLLLRSPLLGIPPPPSLDNLIPHPSRALVNPQVGIFSAQKFVARQVKLTIGQEIINIKEEKAQSAENFGYFPQKCVKLAENFLNCLDTFFLPHHIVNFFWHKF